MIYTTLKQNRENNIDFVQYVDETVYQVGHMFEDEYIDKHGYTDWERLEKDFSYKQIESTVLKWIKEDAKDKEDGCFYKFKKFLIDRAFAYMDVEELIQKGLITGGDLRKIKEDSKKYHFSFSGDVYEDGEWVYKDYDDLRDKYFPCASKLTGECNNCQNCY